MASAQDPLLQKAGTVPPSKEPGLLFYLSGDRGFNADYAAGGVAQPNYQSDVKIMPGGAHATGFVHLTKVRLWVSNDAHQAATAANQPKA